MIGVLLYKKYYKRRGLPRLPPLLARVAATADAFWALASGVRLGRPLLPPPTGLGFTSLGARDLGRPRLPPERSFASAFKRSL